MESQYIVLIEDDQDDATIFMDTFSSEFPSVAVQYFTRPEEFWQFLDKAHTLPSVIVSDYYLQHLTADELIGRLRQQKKTEGIPIVVLSSVSTSTMTSLAGFFRIFHFIKPTSIWDYRWLAAGIMEIAIANNTLQE